MFSCRVSFATITSIRRSGCSRKRCSEIYEKPSEKAVREEAEAIRRARKAARKKARWEGLIGALERKCCPAGRPTAAIRDRGRSTAPAVTWARRSTLRKGAELVLSKIVRALERSHGPSIAARFRTDSRFADVTIDR